MCVYVSARAGTHASVCMQRPEDGSVLFITLPVPWSQGLFLDLRFLFSQLGWKSTSPRDLPVSGLHGAEVTGVCWARGAGIWTLFLMIKQQVLSSTEASYEP